MSTFQAEQTEQKSSKPESDLISHPLHLDSSLSIMDHELALKSSILTPAKFSALPEDLVALVVGFIRSWAEEEELGKDFEEQREKGG